MPKQVQILSTIHPRGPNPLSSAFREVSNQTLCDWHIFMTLQPECLHRNAEIGARDAQEAEHAGPPGVGPTRLGGKRIHSGSQAKALPRPGEVVGRVPGGDAQGCGTREDREGPEGKTDDLWGDQSQRTGDCRLVGQHEIIDPPGSPSKCLISHVRATERSQGLVIDATSPVCHDDDEQVIASSQSAFYKTLDGAAHGVYAYTKVRGCCAGCLCCSSGLLT